MASERLLKDELLHILERQPGSYNALLEDWRLFLLKEKGIYATLNFCEGEALTLRGQIWYPLSEEDFVRRILIAESRATQSSAMLITDRGRGFFMAAVLSSSSYLHGSEWHGSGSLHLCMAVHVIVNRAWCLSSSCSLLPAWK